jgi:hypothetical protein
MRFLEGNLSNGELRFLFLNDEKLFNESQKHIFAIFFEFSSFQNDLKSL